MDYGRSKKQSRKNPFIRFLLFRLSWVLVILLAFLISPGSRVLYGNVNWLDDWDNRIELKINHEMIDDSLSDFPVMVYLSDSSGINSADVSSVFEELGTNWKKIAVTTDDGTTQCFVEVEKWEPENQQAWLWVKVPAISSTTDTKLFLYFDNTKQNNSDYVGDPGSVPSENVWDNDFLGVLPGHFYDGSSDYLALGNNNFNHKLSDCAGLTFSAWINPSSLRDGEAYDKNVITDIPIEDTSSGFFMALRYGGELMLGGKSTPEDSFQSAETSHSVVNTGALQHITGIMDYSGNKIIAYLNGKPIIEENKDFQSSFYEPGTGGTEYIGASTELPENHFFHGIIDVVTISGTVRSPAWIKADYHSVNDSLISFFDGRSYHIAGETEVTGKAEVTVKPLLYNSHSRKLTTHVTVKNTTEDTHIFDGTVEVVQTNETEQESIGLGNFHDLELEGGEKTSFKVVVTLSESLLTAHSIDVEVLIRDD